MEDHYHTVAAGLPSSEIDALCLKFINSVRPRPQILLIVNTGPLIFVGDIILLDIRSIFFIIGPRVIKSLCTNAARLLAFITGVTDLLINDLHGLLAWLQPP